jgi:hypothetical protein
VWELATGQAVTRFSHPGEIHAVAFAGGGSVLAGGSDRSMVQRQRDTGRPLLEVRDLAGTVLAIGAHGDGRRIVTVCAASEAAVRPVEVHEAGRPRRVFGKGPVQAAAVAGDGRILLGVGRNIELIGPAP